MADQAPVVRISYGIPLAGLCAASAPGGDLVVILGNATNGRLLVDSLTSTAAGTARTYRASLFMQPVANATDFFTIYGSASQIVRIYQILIVTASAPAINYSVSVLRRSTANAGGTSAAVAAVLADSADTTAATATVLSYSVNPAGLGTLTGAIGSLPSISAVGVAVPLNAPLSFVVAKPQTLRGVAEGLTLNLNAAAGPITVGVSIEWTESA